MTMVNIKGITLGVIITLLDPFARLLVLVLAIRGKYPWWIVTPDDPKSPFGLYEPAMRRVYRFGRWWGDVCWLAGRNVLFGLAYYFKPPELMFSSLGVVPGRMDIFKRGRVTRYTFGEYRQWTIELFPGFGIQVGWKVDGYLGHERFASTNREPSMQGRPIFSIRRLG